MDKVYITGHRNPDTDSIVSAMAYAALKNALGQRQYCAARLGQISDETKAVLDKFGAQPPELINNVRTQVRDLDFDTPPTLSPAATISRAWQMMQADRISVLPVANEDGTLYGMLSAGDVASYDMLAVRNSTVKNVPVYNLLSVLEGKVLNEGGQIRDEISGEVTIALPVGRENLLFSSPDSIVVCGDQPDMIKRALELRVTCVIVCQAEVDPELVEECLDKLGFDLDYGGYPGAAAYLGYREKGDTSKLSDWMLENCLDLTAEMPVMLTIPSERVLGPGYGKLFCVIPRGENTSLAVNHITWQSQGNGLHPVADEVLYREEYTQPVLLFVNPEEPDMEVNLVADDGTVVNWYPQEDLYGDLILPASEEGRLLLFDFSIYTNTIAIDHPEGWEPSGDDWWWPPTDLGLADTSWDCDEWTLELHYGDCDPDYAGLANLYECYDDRMDLRFFGVWLMEDDCLRLDMSAGVGSSLSGSFPVLISPPASICTSSAPASVRDALPAERRGLHYLELALRLMKPFIRNRPGS